ncbi:hypothetical protein SAMN06265795_11976 [Noviherbaspirillum humi]|uniref:AsmA domain-containing protein n=1 Tax=Noviherbaspirillum humi TaxID=1688639 RepID=A0A239L606_9BURK|nr:AsmA family protein [Noviherbaspirillum humi]SNT25765.1 hypothetical protein SAMN06265795_11976 [Noviherbaspirillum humi]
MTRALKIILLTLGGLIGLVVLVFALLAVFPWNRVKPWINEKVSVATERQFAINGDLSLRWERPPQEQEGWRRWIPWPHLRAQDVFLGNPDWARTGPRMAHAQQVDFTVSLLELLRKHIVVRSLLLTEPNLVLEKDKQGRSNWTFPKKEEKKSDWQFDLDDIALTKGTVRYVDAEKRADINARIDTLEDGSVTWKLAGDFNDEKLTGSGKAGRLMSLQARDVKYPVQAEVKVGETTITADGTLTDPAHLSALDVNLKILGASMADLFPLSGVLLPSTPKFSTEGRVVGSVARDDFHLRYENFKGKVGSSDIGGTLEYRQRDPRPFLSGEVVSNYLNFKDLGALVSTDPRNKEKKSGGVKQQPANKVLPVEPFKTDRWRKMDVDVKFSGKKIIRSEDLPIDNLSTHVKMNKGVLSLNPLNFGVAGGRLTTDLVIDGSGEPAKAKMNVAARGLQLKQLFPAVQSMRASIGQLNGDAQLSAAGNSFADLLASSNGEVKSLITQGSVSKFILEAMGLNIGSAVVAKLFGDRQVQLNCMAADFGVTNGLMATRSFVVDTQDATILVDGSINFAKEQLDLHIRPDSKGIRIISLRSPLHVAGTFKHPDVGIDKGIVALKAGAAAVLGTVASPFAALLALINPGPGEDPPCSVLLKDAGKKPRAPSPEKAASLKENARR